MTLLKCEKVSKSYLDETILKEISFNVNNGEKIGLVGVNGAGKSTLARIIAGEEATDEGTIIRPQKIAYLKQAIRDPLQLFEVDQDTEFKQTLQQQSQFASRLGLEGIKDWSRDRLIDLSGGERTKLALASVWDLQADLIILDEPTNHMDQQGTHWLLEAIKAYSGAVMIISHDRYFLDQVVDKIIELENTKAYEYPGNYTEYRLEKKRRHEQQLHAFDLQLKEERKIEAEVERLKNWSNKAHTEARQVAIQTGMKFGGKEFYRAKAKKMDKQVKSRIKRLEKLKGSGLTRPDDEQDVFFEFQGGKRRGQRLIEVSGLTKSLGSLTLFEKASFYIKSGERVGIIGPNGCGKSTLLKILLGSIPPDQGTVWVSPSAKVGYLSQDVLDLDESLTPLDFLSDKRMKGEVQAAKSLLMNMGFNDQQTDHPIRFLSLGERTKVKLAQLLLKQLDVLILDEPTNHLDLINREQLEETLTSFKGTLILVSHDAYFLNQLTDKLLVFEDQKINRVEAGHKAYNESASTNIEKSSPQTEAERLLFENRMTEILTKLSQCKIKDDHYKALEKDYLELLSTKDQFEKQ